MNEGKRMAFWKLGAPDDRIAVVEMTGQLHTYGQLQAQVSHFGYQIQSDRKRLGLVLCQNQLPDLIAYLAALQSGDAVMLVDGGAPRELLRTIIDKYEPDWISSQETLNEDAYESIASGLYMRREQDKIIHIHPELALMLSTSGTTGSIKFVRLSYRNVESNAASIAEYLQLNMTDRPILSLPMQYSYGLSVINSHLQVGASMIMTSESIISKPFWNLMKSHHATSIAGVPYTYQMLERLKFDRTDLPSLRTLTQAGGRLPLELASHFDTVARNKGYRFFVMYGQTEATARMSYVPPDRLSEKMGSIGIPIPRGQFHITAERSELVYEGPNVMMGYAYDRSDLAKGDELQGTLLTGDIAQIDDEGYAAIKGRLSRFVKLFGLRISLDDIERQVEQTFRIPVACAGTDEKVNVVLEDQRQGIVEQVREYIARSYGLHHSSYKVWALEKLPRLANGKLDYQRLKDM